jgi:adenine phosphoribosyltransferase
VASSTVAEARAALLGEFRWHGGHADLSLALRSPELLSVVGSALAAPFRESHVDAVLGIEARGFAPAALAAQALGVGLVLARKPGSVHPGAVGERAATPDWRGRIVDLRISRRAVRPGDRLLLVDDWIETGAQARTAARLAGRLGATLVGTSVLVDGTNDAVREELKVVGLAVATELPPDPRGS